MRCKVLVLFFCMRMFSFPSPVCKRDFLFLQSLFYLYQKSRSLSRVGSFLGPLFYSTDLVASLCSHAVHFDCCGSLLGTESDGVVLLRLFFWLGTTFLLLNLSRSICSISLKNVIAILMGLALKLKITFSHSHFLYINSSVWAWDTFSSWLTALTSLLML